MEKAKHWTSSSLKFQTSTQPIAHCSNPTQLNIMSSALQGSWSSQFSLIKQLCRRSMNRLKQTWADSYPTGRPDWSDIRSFSRTTWNTEEPRPGSGRLIVNIVLQCSAAGEGPNTVLIRSVPRKGPNWVHAWYSECKDKLSRDQNYTQEILDNHFHQILLSVIRMKSFFCFRIQKFVRSFCFFISAMFHCNCQRLCEAVFRCSGALN